MYPAYLMTVILSIAYRFQYHSVQRLPKFIKPVFSFALFPATFLPVLIPVFHFPDPAGPYAFGKVIYHWTDRGRREYFDPDGTRRRELMVQVWYPAKHKVDGKPSAYLPKAPLISGAMSRLQGKFPRFFLDHLGLVSTHSQDSIPVANDQARFPVLIFLEGLTGYRQMNTFQVEALVSQGYIVVGIDQPGVAATVVFPDGHQIFSPGRKLSETELPYFTEDVG